MIRVYLNDKPATPDDCHSYLDVANAKSAISLCWWMAKQDKPEYARWREKRGFEWTTNWHMRDKPLPKTVDLTHWIEHFKTEPKLQPECTVCGGHDIKHDAYASWDIEEQDWVLITTFDSSDCEDCGGECSYNMVEVAA